MFKTLSGMHIGDIRPILGAIRSVQAPIRTIHAEVPAPTPFITISREAGAGGRSLAERLVERLNEIDPGERAWSAWDRELVEKVAADHAISTRLVESLEVQTHSWIQEMLGGMSVNNDAYVDEAKIYRRVASTIRALAQVGRVVIVGRGGAYITAGMDGGMHARLVAPEPWRIDYMAKLMNVPLDVAAGEVRRLDHNREAFLKRYWPGRAHRMDMFTLTLNVSQLTEEQAVTCITQLVPRPVAAG